MPTGSLAAVGAAIGVALAGQRPVLGLDFPDELLSAAGFEDPALTAASPMDLVVALRAAGLAEQVDGLLLPAGPELALYDADGFHPSMRGSYLAALVVVGQLAGVDLVVAPVLHLPDRRSFDDADRQLDAGAERVSLDLEVVEVAHAAPHLG